MLDANLNSMTVMGINAETGTEKQLSSRRWFRVGQIAWMPDESGLVIVGTSQSWITYQLWYLLYPAGHAQQISNDLNDYGRVSLTGDGKRLVTIQLNRLSNLWVAPHHKRERRETNYRGIRDLGKSALMDSGWTDRVRYNN